ncbi:MAG: cytidine deaminase [bacterium]
MSQHLNNINNTSNTIKNLIECAFNAQKLSYSPYSNFQVGASLLCSDGSIFNGCNIENIAYSPTNCAERTAFFNAISQGNKSFSCIAIVGSPKGRAPTDYCYPCGVCRQVMAEFCTSDFKVIVAKSVDDYIIYSLSDFLPLSFNF